MLNLGFISKAAFQLKVNVPYVSSWLSTRK